MHVAINTWEHNMSRNNPTFSDVKDILAFMRYRAHTDETRTTQSDPLEVFHRCAKLSKISTKPLAKHPDICAYLLRVPMPHEITDTMVERICAIKENMLARNEDDAQKTILIFSKKIIEGCFQKPQFLPIFEYLLKHNLPFPTSVEYIFHPNVESILRTLMTNHSYVISQAAQDLDGTHSRDITPFLIECKTNLKRIERDLLELCKTIERSTQLPTLFSTARRRNKEDHITHTSPSVESPQII